MATQKEYAKIRMESQASQDEKILKADFIIYNESTLEELENNIRLVIGQIR